MRVSHRLLLFPAQGLSAPRSASLPDKKSLCLGDLEVNPVAGILQFTVRHTKTVQFGQRTLRIPISSMADCLLCPVAAVQGMLDCLSASQPLDVILFSFVDGHGVMSCFDYNSFVAK